MLRVGLTGGIGAGKSTVAGRLAEHGALVIDADRIAREVVEPGTDGLAEVTEAFGREVLAADGSLDRPALGRRVFNDQAARDTLNGILHPKIGARTADLMSSAAPDSIVVHDVPLLVENELGAGYQLVVVVDAPERTRIQRLLDSREMSAEDARSRIAAQASSEQRRAAADVWLDNGRSRDLVLAEVDALWADRLVPFEANVRLHRPAGRSSQPALVEHDPSWAQQAGRLLARISAVAGQRAHSVEHIGSTSVPGLDAKDVLDLQVVVDDTETAGKLADELITAGLVRNEGRWWDVAMDGTEPDKAMATNGDPARPVNCHIRPLDSPAWRESLLFRDWLRAHPDGAREYAELKHRLAAGRHESMDDYADRKTPFVSASLARAETWAAETGWQPLRR